ncbi:unnamed protein product [Schistosoma turkestanicum]|nr:unnamed protein product [Schistosoma turkestanicum]
MLYYSWFSLSHIWLQYPDETFWLLEATDKNRVTNYISKTKWEKMTIIIQDPKITKKIKTIRIRIKKKTVIIVITNRVQNMVLARRLLHHRIRIIKRSNSHVTNDKEPLTNLFI